MSRRELQDPLKGTRVPAPPAALRERVLDSARDALRAAPQITYWDRLWTHPGLRLAWTFSVVALLTAHTALSLQSRHGVAGTTAVVAETEASVDEEFRQIVDLPPFDISPSAAGMAPENPEPLSGPDPSESQDRRQPEDSEVSS
ncbi:hypothetical protein ABI59_12280 [Acidobacteria bacterium Mor1]|nr:hypothetical protein ABI59_12280 [Acidobacteria bacterium Mor1]